MLIPSFFGLFLICFLIIYDDTTLFRALSSIEYYSRASRFIDYNILQFKYAIEFGVEKEIIDSFSGHTIQKLDLQYNWSTF